MSDALSGSARLLLRLSVLLALLAATLVAGSLTSEAVTRPRTLYHERPVTTGVVEPGFPIDHVGVVFDLPPGADVYHDHEGDHHPGTEGLAVRFRTAGVWGPWQAVIEDGAQALGTFTGALVPGGDADAYQVRGIPASGRNARAAALNTTDGPREVVGHRPAGSAEAVTSCRSRADWGADESIRTSDRSYAPVQLMTVHHTATQNDDPDPAARVRAIYEYHVKTNKWDDIGYQALIAEDGTVYEGRWSGSDSPSCVSQGGTGWEFGHAGTTADADMVTGAHTGGYNTGNFGVALLGTLTDVPPKAGARSALVEYLAELAERHGIQADGDVHYDNGTNAGTFKAISGHRDFTATECPGGTLYADLPNLRTEVAAAVTTNATPTVRITAPTDLDTHTAYETTAGDGVTITFGAGATDDSAGLSWRWTQDGTQVSTASTFTATYPVGTYTLDAYATDTEGATGHDTVTLRVEPPVTYVDDVSSGEQAVTGTVSGTYVDTQADGGAAETITEVESGGPPKERHSLLEHVWSVPVTGGSTVTLFVDATVTASTDGDDVAFAYSLDGGSTYTTVLTVPGNGVNGTYSAALPASASGTVHVRARDTNRAKGTRALDRLTVDHLLIRSETSETTTTLAAPSSITANATSATTVDVAWQDVSSEWGYELQRGPDADGNGVVDSWATIANLAADQLTYPDSGLTAATTYGYRVRATQGTTVSDWTTPALATTHSVSGITLTADGYKVKGQHHVDLTWSGATSVRILRDGVAIADRSGSTYTDVPGGSGKGQYRYHVCALDSSGTVGTCSDEVTVTFS